MKTFALLAGSALALAACAQETETEEVATAEQMTAEATPPAAAAEAPVPASGQEYADMAGASDLFEIESSQLAVERSQNAQVRELAQMLVTDHQTSTAALQTAAAAATPAVTVSPALMPPQQNDITALRAATDAEFDQTYLEQQVRAHETALAMLRGYAEGGDVASLTQHASQNTGPVERHLEMARGLLSSAGAATPPA